MVTVIGYENRQTEEGREFCTLTIQGGVEVVTSENGNMYMTARKTNIPSTFDEDACKLLVGQTIPGEIVKIECDPYDYTNKRTGEVITLTHTYEYVNEEKKEEPQQYAQPEYMPYMEGNVPVGA